MAPAKWRRFREWSKRKLPTPQLILLVVVALNVVFLLTFGSIFLLLINGTSANATIITQYTTAVMTFLFVIISIIVGFTVSERHNKVSERIGITATTGCLCGGTLIVYGAILVGGLLVFGCLTAFVIYRIMR